MATAGIPFPVSANNILPVAFSATPVFDASKVGMGGTFLFTLTGNVTSSTLVNGFQGQVVNFMLVQDGTGSRTIVYPTNAGGIPNILSAANAITRFSLQFDGVAWQGYGPLQLQQIAAYSNATTGFTSIPELGFTLAANRNYTAIFHLTWSASNTAAAPKYQVTGPGSPTAVLLSLLTPVTVTTLGLPAAATAFSSAVANPATVTTSTNFTDHVMLRIQNGANAGTAQLQAAATAANALTFQPGSGGIVICS